MKLILYSLLAALLPFGSVLADAPKEKNDKEGLLARLKNCRGFKFMNHSCPSAHE
jgi:hypothetical protein